MPINANKNDIPVIEKRIMVEATADHAPDFLNIVEQVIKKRIRLPHLEVYKQNVFPSGAIVIDPVKPIATLLGRKQWYEQKVKEKQTRDTPLLVVYNPDFSRLLFRVELSGYAGALHVNWALTIRRGQSKKEEWRAYRAQYERGTIDFFEEQHNQNFKTYLALFEQALEDATKLSQEKALQPEPPDTTQGFTDIS